MKTRQFLTLLLVLFLVSCAPLNLWGAAPVSIPAETSAPVSSPTIIPPPTQTASPFPSLTATFAPTFTLEPALDSSIVPTSTNTASGIKHVVIVSYDGLRPDAIAAAPMTNVLGLMDSGAYSLKARTISYASTLPAHASMLSGMCLAKHGVDWDVTTYYKGYSKGTDIFDLAHAAGLKSVMIVNKEKLRQLAEPETTDVFELVYGTEAVIMKTAIEQMTAGFDLMFVHIGSPDYRGHKYGWMSNAQLQALRNGDAALGLLLNALDQYGLRDSTLIIITADHGGHDQNHDGTRIEDLQIPWIASGPGIVQMELTTPIQTMDTAATAAYALELPIPSEWDGVPVYEAFGLPIGERKEVVCP